MAASSSSSSSSSELPPPPQQQVVEVDQFRRLPNEVVMMMVNKLIHAKTLVRFSMVAKRYSALVSQAHSLLMDFTVVGTPTPTPSPYQPPNYTCPFHDEKMSLITNRFKQIKHLHIHIRNTPRQAIPLGNGRFSQWVAVYGSRLEHVHFLAATSVLPYPNPVVDVDDDVDGSNTDNGSIDDDVNGSNTDNGSIDGASDLYWSGVFQTTLNNVASMHYLIRYVLQQCKRVESVVFTNNSTGGGGALFMGKQQIAKLRMDEGIPDEIEGRYQQRVVVFRKPALDLPQSGYTLKDVVFTKLFTASDAQVSASASAFDPVASYSMDVLKGLDVGVANVVGKWRVLADDEAGKKNQMMKVSPTSDSAAIYSLDGLDVDFDMDKWQVLLEATHLIDKENKEPMYAYTLLRSPPS